jgi:hypothetical protein
MQAPGERGGQHQLGVDDRVVIFEREHQADR